MEFIDINDPRVLFVEAKSYAWAGSVSVDKITEALSNHGVPTKYHPVKPSKNVCLKRAMKSLADNRMLIRPLPKCDGYSLVEEKPEELDLTSAGSIAHTIELTVKLDNNGNLEFTPVNHVVVPIVEAEMNRHYNEEGGLLHCGTDLSTWMSSTIMPWVNGISTRKRGGSYYVTKGKNLDNLRKVVDALHSISSFTTHTRTILGKNIGINKVHKGGLIVLKPEVTSVDSISIFMDSIISECDSAIDELAAGLSDKKVNTAGVKSRKLIVSGMMEKIKHVEELLQTNLEDVRARIDEVSVGIEVAEFAMLDKSRDK